LVTEVAKDGAKVFVEIGPGCVGQVLQGELGAGFDDANRVLELRNQKIPVQVTNAPDRDRRAPLQLSRRSALERQQRLTELESVPSTPALKGKVSRVFEWGAVVSVNGADGVMLKVDMGNLKLSEEAEIPVEIIKLEAQQGYLGLKAVVAPTDANFTGEPSDNMADDTDMEEANLQPSGRFQADGDDPAEKLNDQERVEETKPLEPAQGQKPSSHDVAGTKVAQELTTNPQPIRTPEKVPARPTPETKPLEPAPERPPTAPPVGGTNVVQKLATNSQPTSTPEKASAKPADGATAVFACSECQKKLRAKSSLAGQGVKCPLCGKQCTLLVP
jgi:DNA-directed RNA polymerase subunit RPC12/RpoP